MYEYELILTINEDESHFSKNLEFENFPFKQFHSFEC